MPARLLIVIAIVLGVLAMHATPPAGIAPEAAGHPLAVAAAGSAPTATAVISSDSDLGGCCCTATCEAMSATCVTLPCVSEGTTPHTTVVAEFQNADARAPAVWPATAQASPRQRIGLAIAALAVARI